MRVHDESIRVVLTADDVMQIVHGGRVSTKGIVVEAQDGTEDILFVEIMKLARPPG